MNTKRLWTSLSMQASIVIFSVVLMCAFGQKNEISKKLFHFGPQTDDIQVSFLNILIDNKIKYWLLMSWLFVSSFISTVAHKRYKAWYRNCILDPKAKDAGMSKEKALILVNTWEVFSFVNKTINLFIVLITRQLQFLIPMWIGRRIASSIIDYQFMTEQKQHNNKKK